MDPTPSAPPFVERLARWNASTQDSARLLGLGLVCLLLACISRTVLPADPAGWAAAPAGLALAAATRWGRAMVFAGACGLWLGLLALGVPISVAAYVGAATALSGAVAHAVLVRLAFEGRFERQRDLQIFVGGVAVVAAPALALLTAAWITANAGAHPWWAFLKGWATLTLGMLGAAVPLLALDRRALRALQPGSPWAAPLIGVLIVLLLWAGLWKASDPRHTGAAWLLYAPHVLLGALALRGQLALASGGLLGCGLIVAGLRDVGVSAPGWPTASDGALAAWFGSALALLLLAHGSLAHWRGRAKRWEWALDASRLGVADWRVADTDGFASMAWRTLAGHTDRAWSPAAWVRQVNPEDRDLLQEAIDSLTNGSAGRQQLELRLPDGSGWRWVESTLLVVERDARGRPIRLLATLADVQERREAVERKRMSASLFQHLHEGLLITDADQRALDVNPAYTQILGVTRQEILGTVPSLLRPAPGDPVARQQRAAMWASLRDTGSWRGELLERRRNGELCTLQATISTVPGPARDLRYHVLVISDITEQRVQREQLERQAHYDELTRLPNRARLSQLLDDAMTAADRDGYLLAVCYLDLDRFKPVNDKYGHAAGDRLLAELAGRLRSALRSREHWVDSAARLGGDEFVLLLRAGTMEEARLAVERVLRVVSLPYIVDPALDPVPVTASMGATVYPIDRSDADTLLRHADHAMYGAKQAGRNRYLFFDPEHRRRTEAKVMAIGRIQEALDKSEFVLYYQPKVDMRSGRVHGLEALLRWDDPERGLVAPLQFLPLIEDTGLSSRIGDWVLSQALEHLSQWRRGGLEISVSVNISARHFQEPDFAQRLAELLARHGEPLAAHLELEMLEGAMHADIEATSALLRHCQATGVRFALDDFGTGFSYLSYLKKLPVDVLKIDRSFVHHMLDDLQDRAIVEGVIALARTFGCQVVAEGVESPAQARTLLELGCDIGQGTGIATPMPSDQVAGWVRDYRGMFALVPAEPALGAAGGTGTRR